MEGYITLKQESVCESVISRSRFISRCFPVQSEEEALEKLAAVRAQYPDARHVCYAYRVGMRGETARFSDAGEPSGTAGMPILEVLRTNEITYALCTVTRYFGGVLLGTGGLARAYGGGAAEALRLAGRLECLKAVRYALTLDYARFSALEGYLKKSCRIDGISYTESIQIIAAVELGAAAEFEEQIVQRSDGRAVLSRMDTVYIEREF